MPSSGADVTLTIDATLQRYAEQLMEESEAPWWPLNLRRERFWPLSLHLPTTGIF